MKMTEKSWIFTTGSQEGLLSELSKIGQTEPKSPKKKKQPMKTLAKSMLAGGLGVGVGVGAGHLFSKYYPDMFIGRGKPISGGQQKVLRMLAPIAGGIAGLTGALYPYLADKKLSKELNDN